jgi:hypothetical protein
MIVLREESLAVGRFAATPKWLRSPETDPLFNETDIIVPLKWVRFSRTNPFANAAANGVGFCKSK